MKAGFSQSTVVGGSGQPAVLCFFIRAFGFMPPRHIRLVEWLHFHPSCYLRISGKHMICFASWIKHSCVWMSAVTWGFGKIVCWKWHKTHQRVVWVYTKTQLGKYFPHCSPMKRENLPSRGTELACQISLINVWQQQEIFHFIPA